MKKNNTLTDFEYTLLWMAIRYAMNRQTIASATLPIDIVENYYKKLSPHEKESIVIDLKRNIEENNKFGDPNIDNPVWMKFMNSLDEKTHQEVELIDNTKRTVFYANGRIYPLDKYLENPYQEIFIPEENIKKII
jgi:hypothetical protein